MKIVIFGAGGIGAYLGGCLARAGNDVQLICRGKHLEAIQKNGLKVLDYGEEWVATNVVAGEGLIGSPPDVVINAVKLYDLRESGRLLKNYIGPETVVIPISNGVTAHEELAKEIPLEQIVPGAVYMSSHVPAPGVVMRTSESTRFRFGELNGEQTVRVVKFNQAGLDAGYQSEISRSIFEDLWKKFVFLNAVAPLSLLTRLPVGVLRTDRRLRELVIQSMHEVLSIARGKGIALSSSIVEESLTLLDKREYGAKVSVLTDLEAGRKLEIDWICGYVSREAKAQGRSAPIADLAYSCMRPYANGRPVTLG